MPAPSERPPQRVCAAFGVDPAELQPLDLDAGWRGSRIVLRRVTDTAEAVWAGRSLGGVSLPDLRIAKLAQATDGRQIVGGWMAYRTTGAEATGEPSVPGFDEYVLVSVKLHQALADLPRPEFIGKRTDLLARADRMAWGEEEAELDEARGGRWFEVLAGSLKQVSLPDQVVHGNLYRSVRFDGHGPPTVIDFRPYFRPAEWAAALVVIDAIALGGADAELVDRWSHLPAWRQMLLRATLFRLAAHALNPEADAADLDGLRRAAGIVSQFA